MSPEKATYRDYFHRRWMPGLLSLVVAAAAVSSASGFRWLEHNFVTVGPNHSKLGNGMHVSVQCQATHLFQ